MPRQELRAARQWRSEPASKRRFCGLLLVVGMVFLGACAGSSRGLDTKSRSPAESTTLILISLDGFRWDFMELAETPTLDRLAASGVRAQRLIPVFPTKTFPNHYSIATGLYPEHHGIVANNFYDPAFDASFVLAEPATHSVAQWWEGEPIWVTAERQGLTAATYFWPGSEEEFDGIRPTHWKPYDQNVPYEERIDQVLTWLDSDKNDRPDFIALYVDLIDTVTHSHDPESSPEVAAAIRTVDDLLGRLLEGLALSGHLDRVNLMVVSDHGMASTSPNRVIFLDDYLATEELRILDWDPVLSIWPDPGEEDEVYDTLAGAHPHLRILRKDDIPNEWHYRDHRRIPPILGVADEGWSITSRPFFASDPAFFEGANHGYEPSIDSMGALFLANGPAFEEGLIVPPVEAVDLYELMCSILGLEPAMNDGDLTRVQHLLHH